MVVGDVGVRGVGAAEAVAGGGRLGDGVGHLVGVGAEDRGEDLAQGRLRGVGVQQVDVRLEGVHAEAVEEFGGAQRVAEAAQAVELGEGADQLGLVVGVLVVAVRGVEGDAAALLVRVALPGLVQVGVDLEGEGCAGGEELEEEGQARAELRDRRRAEFLLRVGVDDLGQCAARGARGGSGVGAHPHLRLRLAGRLGAEQPRDGGDGTPGVGADGVVEAVHGALCVLSAGSARSAGSCRVCRIPSARAPGGQCVPGMIRLRRRAPGKRRRNP
ncbi:hypothetical protein SGRIM128S_09640 [Streptomyces griseomycini]